jgi:hypothetical protein
VARPPAVRRPGPDSTAVPIELLDGDRAVVLATLDGRGPYRLAVETAPPTWCWPLVSSASWRCRPRA